jgi:acyl dehydratase
MRTVDNFNKLSKYSIIKQLRLTRAKVTEPKGYSHDAGFEIGTVIGNSEWVSISQELIDGFGRYTLDPDPFHIDPDWAKQHSPFGGTIAFGFLTISLLTHLLHKAQGSGARDTAADPAIHGHYLNYGFNRLRLVSPVPVDAKVCGKFIVKDIQVDPRGRKIFTFDSTIKIENEPRPALVADWLAIWVPGEGQ